MHAFSEILTNQTLGCVLIAWFAAQAIKVPTYWYIEKKLDWHRFLESGGMPSSHTASVIALTIMVGAQAGWATPALAICVVLSCIVMYDATGVRRETGHQSQIINEILRKVFVDGQPISDDELKELIGHSPLEVLMGFLLGLTVACIYLLFC